MTDRDPSARVGTTRGRLDEAEVEALFARMPDPVARDEIATRFVPFAEYLARRFAGRGESIEDLTQVAMIGLLNAVDRFDPSREVQFSTYAAATIVGELKRHFRDKGWALRVPRGYRSSPFVNRALPELTQTLGRSPTIPELAEQLGVGTDEIADAMDAVQAYSTSSLDTPVGEEGQAPLDSLGEDDPSIALLDEWSSLAPAVAESPLAIGASSTCGSFEA